MGIFIIVSLVCVPCPHLISNIPVRIVKGQTSLAPVTFWAGAYLLDNPEKKDPSVPNKFVANFDEVVKSEGMQDSYFFIDSVFKS